MELSWFEQEFIRLMNERDKPAVLEIGTYKTTPTTTTFKHKLDGQVPGMDFIGIDCREGENVDQVADAHRLADVFPANHFDGVISLFTFEHLARPWVVAHQIRHVLKPGGFVWVCTHQTYPLHYYPYDYFRFSKEAMAILFDEVDGWEMIKNEYSLPAVIMPHTNRIHGDTWNFQSESWLHVEILARKK